VVHFGDAGPVVTGRQAVLTAAYAAHPERFVRQPPTPPALPTVVWINAPGPTTLTLEARQ
jgi:putative transposase